MALHIPFLMHDIVGDKPGFEIYYHANLMTFEVSDEAKTHFPNGAAICSRSDQIWTRRQGRCKLGLSEEGQLTVDFYKKTISFEKKSKKERGRRKKGAHDLSS